MTMTTTPTMLQCPFCGSARLSDECTGAAEISGHTYQTGWIECRECGCDGPSVDLTDETPLQNDYQLVRDAWNRRADVMLLVANELECIAHEPPVNGNMLAQARLLLRVQQIRSGAA